MNAQSSELRLSLRWEKGRHFAGESEGTTIVLDGDKKAGPSPVQAVAFALAGCMGIDIVDIIEKGRLPLRGLSCDLAVTRAPEPPRKITKVHMAIVVGGDIPQEKVARAIDLSRDKYCSVWHSMNPGIEFTTSFEVRP